MKSKMKRRMLAIVLCMVIALSNSSFIFASSGTEEPAAVAQEGDPQNVQETQTEAAVQDTPAVLSETTPEATPEATPEPTQVPEVTAAPTEAPQATAEPTQAPEVTAAPEATPAPTEAPAVTVEPTQAPEVTAAPETTPEATPVPTEAPVTYNEAVELRHEFKDENGNVTATVTAQIPAGAFQADASELTMEVTVPDQATTEHVKKLMEESLPEHYMLGDTVLYDIRFKVNGTETESQQPIVITFKNQNGITVKDVKKAVVFQLDPADPAVEGDKDELVTITQRNDMIESLQNSGQSTDNVDNYDLSEITLKEDGTSNKIQMEGRTSTIYGCYAYYEPVQVLTYEDDQVTVTVSAAENGVIPANAELKVVPITEDKETEDQYKDVEKKLQEKAEEEEYEIAGFLAYDITFVDPDGNETEPNGEVKVSIDYKEAAIPESVSEEDAQNAEVTVMHLEEDEKGEVKKVVDMAQTEKVDVLATTEENKVEKVEVRTESFSAYVVTWHRNNSWDYKVQISSYYGYLDDNGHFVEFTNYSGSRLPQNLANYTGANISLSECRNDTVTVGEDKYYASSAYIALGTHAITEYNSVTKYQAQQLSINIDRRDKYYNDGGWKTLGSALSENDTRYYTVYFLYKAPPKPIITEDTSKTIDIALYNYSYDGFYDGLRFGGDLYPGGYHGRQYNFNKWVSHWGDNGDQAVQGILDNKLYTREGAVSTILDNWEGIPKVNLNDNLADQLFSENTLVKDGLNHLFRVDSSGYYEYDSSKNYAYYPGDDKTDFIVYDQAFSKGNNTEGDFMPLLDYDEYPSNTSDMWSYGMRVGFNFIQPEDGQINGNPMVFSFSGDDDVWVFIDGQLVLDLGGIHGTVDGSINFATGEVTVSDVADASKSDIPGGVDTLGEKTSLKEIFELNGETFDSYTEHRLEFIYFERGASMSNCKLRFNLQPIPSDSIRVKKEITNTDKEKYTDVEFQFKLYVENDNGIIEQVKDTSYTVYDGDNSTGGVTKTLDNTGIFTLKHDQTAQFDGIPRDRKYYVEEVGLNSNEFDQVQVDNWKVGCYDENGEEVDYIEGGLVGEEQSYIARTEERAVYEGSTVVFKNRCSANNLRELQIEKKLVGKTMDDTYSFHIQLENVNGDLVDYEGDYYLIKEGQYYRYENGQLVTDSEEGVCGTISRGIVRNIPAGYTVAITQILSGTRFKVTEIDLSNEYAKPDYKVTNAEHVSDSYSETPTEYASGEIILSVDTKVEVTNRLLSTEDQPFIKVVKKFEGFNPATDQTFLNSFKIEIYSDEACKNKIQDLTLNDIQPTEENGNYIYTWIINDLEAGTYYLKEAGDQLQNYTLTTTVNGEEVNEWPQMVKTQAPTYEKVGEIRVPQGNEREFEFLSNYNFIAATLQKSKTYFVWTEKPLSSGEQEAIKIFIAGCSPNFNQITSNDATIYFYSSLQNLEQGIVVNEGTVKVSEESAGKRTLSFASSSKQWSQVLFGEYKVKDPVDAEISITNHYEEHGVDVDLEKYGTGWKQQIAGAEFELVSGVKSNGKIVWNEGSVETVIVDDTQKSKIDLPKLKSGYYRLKETKAPIGYSLLNDTIYFVVDAGEQTVALTDANGNILQNQTEEFYKIESGKPAIIQIMNKALYDLPSAGGSGIFWYLISGTAFLMAASLILYRMKRKEVLGK